MSGSMIDSLTLPLLGSPPSFVSLWPLLWGLPACRLLAPEAPEILGSLQELWTGPPHGPGWKTLT